jgi:uncharacterized protein YecT (DUF1311 family)
MKIYKPRFIGAFIFILLANPILVCVVHSEDQNPGVDLKDVGLRSSYTKCLDDSGGVTFSLLNCNAAEFKYQDYRLNRVYKSLSQTLGAKDMSSLREDERKWIAYRDSYCSADPESGTASDVDSIGCKVEQTARRANLLEARLHK